MTRSRGWPWRGPALPSTTLPFPSWARPETRGFGSRPSADSSVPTAGPCGQPQERYGRGQKGRRHVYQRAQTPRAVPGRSRYVEEQAVGDAGVRDGDQPNGLPGTSGSSARHDDPHAGNPRRTAPTAGSFPERRHGAAAVREDRPAAITIRQVEPRCRTIPRQLPCARTGGAPETPPVLRRESPSP